jgi:hypothetical protein
VNRQVVSFSCEGSMLLGTLDVGAASGAAGVLIVSGGNEIRSGAWGGQAGLAARLAHEGAPTWVSGLARRILPPPWPPFAPPRPMCAALWHWAIAMRPAR